MAVLEEPSKQPIFDNFDEILMKPNQLVPEAKKFHNEVSDRAYNWQKSVNSIYSALGQIL